MRFFFSFRFTFFSFLAIVVGNYNVSRLICELSTMYHDTSITIIICVFSSYIQAYKKTNIKEEEEERNKFQINFSRAY